VRGGAGKDLVPDTVPTGAGAGACWFRLGPWCLMLLLLVQVPGGAAQAPDA
jgi:hypothetical protein